MKHNLDQAARFLTALTGDENPVVTFQTFDDDDLRKDSRLAIHPHGTLAEQASRLIELNDRGAGIFVMVNAGDGLGRSNTNVIGNRAVFADLDGAPLAAVEAHRIKPHIIVESSPGRFHTYWRVRDLPLEDFAAVQKAIARQFDGDPSVHDLARVMRLPGFNHCKGEPFRTHVVRIAGDLTPYPAEYFERAQPTATGYAPPLAERITSPGRHDALTSLARTLSARGVCEEAIVACLKVVNARQCDPPLAGTRLHELNDIARWAVRQPVLSPMSDSEMPQYTDEEIKAAYAAVLAEEGIAQ